FNKMWMYEQSMKIPLLIRYPKEIKSGSDNNNLVSIVDLATTILDYGGDLVQDDLHGMSIRELLNGRENVDWREALYYHYYGQFDVPAHNGIRTEDYKLIHFYKLDEASKWELYNLKDDPDEMVN